jgi:hypothetical protein
MFRKIFIVAILGVLGLSGWYFYNPSGFTALAGAFSTEEFRTFKIRHSAESIIAAHQKELLSSPESNLEDPKLIYYPFLLMEVKYTQDSKNKTAEGVLLWGLCDGEMITDTSKWEKTRGFEDCIIANVKGEDFAVLRELHRLSGKASREQLCQKLEESDVEGAIDNCITKKLIVEEAEALRLHFENPHFETMPETHCNEFVVSLPKQPPFIAKKRYGASTIEKFASTAFGAHFAIKNSKPIFLPVYEIAVHNQDGTFLKTYWNALNGKRMDALLREI